MTPRKENLNIEKTRPFVIVTGENEEGRFMLRSLLELWGFEVAETADGPASVAVAANHSPDLILMDVTLPFDESLKTVSFIRTHVRNGNVPFVVVSGFSAQEMKDAAVSHGATEFLVKPLDFDGLPDYLTHVIEHSAH